MPELSTVDAITLALVPVSMVLVSLVEQRWGPVVGGTVAAAPVTVMIGLLLVSSTSGSVVSADMAVAMSGYAPAQIGAAATIIAAVSRGGLVLALVAGTGVYGALAWLSLQLPSPVAIALSVAALAVALRHLRPPSTPYSTSTEGAPSVCGPMAVRAGVSLSTAIALYVVAAQVGAAAAGAIGAYPVLTVTLCGFLYNTTGAAGVQQLFTGMVRGLPAFLVFVLLYAATASRIGPAGASILAALICSTCYVLPTAAARLLRPSKTDKPVPARP